MNALIVSATRRAIELDADSATQSFYASLANRRFRGTRCRGCGYIPFPPREHCVRCSDPAATIEWIDLPVRGTLYAFSQQERSWRFAKPDVIGLVELPGVSGLVLTRIVAEIEALAIGQPVELDFAELGPDLVVHQFRPAE